MYTSGNRGGGVDTDSMEYGNIEQCQCQCGISFRVAVMRKKI